MSLIPCSIAPVAARTLPQSPRCLLTVTAPKSHGRPDFYRISTARTDVANHRRPLRLTDAAHNAQRRMPVGQSQP
jgi:hypothetical protein